MSSSGIEAIETSLDHVEPLLQISEAIETVYDVESTAAELLRGGWTRVRIFLWSDPSPHLPRYRILMVTLPYQLPPQVCLQFPDELLHDSVPVFKAVRARLPDAVEVYVMADTTYGRWARTRTAAEHPANC